ncbi:MAG: response regulator [Alphaproteobacteria bacterium]|nr:response regulator [Alphaproteobacteria bacterium]MBU0797769.1 response regulator [Alphaproteobacteria bacterium]MBU0887831.1 response regulator [Alphaproteobacteria bacterium]MBU1814946.1 response regulator [Alphaproteobacteria bacterium]MBU2090290.1 response regulator [Alphaproteobacteria bacterium]
MAGYRLDRLSILLVEDSDFIRNLLFSVLRALEVGQVYTAKDGGEAIEFLKARARLGMPGQAPVDLIISDLIMSPIDGAMLLRWVRRHAESPDRFIPFIMISGAVDRDRVEAIRDLGVSEFLAKPFSVNSVASHLQAAIENPRPFIYTQDYFGPDRRRVDQPISGDDRRSPDKSKLAVVYTARSLRSAPQDARAWMFRLPNRLKDKVLALGGSTAGGIEPELLKAAEVQVQRMADDYADWVRNYVAELQASHASALKDRKKAWMALRDMNLVAHELRGQGATFGYPLITTFGRSLHEYTTMERDTNVVTRELLELIKAHIDGIRAVMADKVKGDGGAVGQELVRMLGLAVKKYKGG